MARSEWKPTKEELKAIYELAKSGCTDEDIIGTLNIAKSTFYKHKSNFFEQLKKGREEGTPLVIDQVVNALIKKATGFEYEEITEEPYYIHKDGYIAVQEGKKMVITKRVKKYVVPSDQAIFYYLGNRAPERWKSVNYAKTEIELGPDAGERFKEIADALEKSDTSSD
jgi:hypothetical protein